MRWSAGLSRRGRSRPKRCGFISTVACLSRLWYHEQGQRYIDCEFLHIPHSRTCITWWFGPRLCLSGGCGCGCISGDQQSQERPRSRDGGVPYKGLAMAQKMAQARVPAPFQVSLSLTSGNSNGTVPSVFFSDGYPMLSLSTSFLLVQAPFPARLDPRAHRLIVGMMP